MVDRGKILADIRLEDVAEASGELLAAVHGGVRALALAAGETVVDERPLEDRFKDAGQGVMDDTIPERGGTDLPGLPLVDRERAVGTGAVGLGGKFLVKPQEFRFEVEEEASDAGLEAFATGGGSGRLAGDSRTRSSFPDVAVSLHAFSSPWLRSQPPTSRPISSMDLAAKP